MKRRVPQLMKEAEHKLLQHSWPGNVRELDNTMQRALILQTGPQLFVNDLLLTPVPGNKHPQLEQPLETVQVEIVQDDGRLGQDLKHREVELILQAIKEEPSRKDAAERLGISPRTLRYKMARLREEGFDVEAMI
tara:strand:- start:1445 stop:1849 length:405 start_codon:yes stop_codon:yes gene_type:complete